MSVKTIISSVAVTGGVMLLCGCNVGPRYVPPAVPLRRLLRKALPRLTAPRRRAHGSPRSRRMRC